MNTRLRISPLVLLASLAAVAALVGATAGTAAAATCPPPPTPLLPFAAWGDMHQYVLTTGGSFETGSSPWALSGGAAVVDDNAPDAFASAGSSHALYLPAGSSATSACVTAPQIEGIVRMWTRSTGGALLVEILVKGGVYSAGVITAGSNWSPSPVLLSNAPDYKGAVTYQVRLTALSGGFTVDDVYFDPYRSR